VLLQDEQKFIEAKIRMRKQELMEDEEREQRKDEGRTTPGTPIDDTSRLVELPESRSSQAQYVNPVIAMTSNGSVSRVDPALLLDLRASEPVARTVNPVVPSA
jgi:hypothetical protein